MPRKPRPFAVVPADYEVQPNGCWIWRRGRNGNGYGVVKCGRDGRGGTALAHRLAYEQSVGPIPDGLVLDHLCRDRACVNPDHLEPVTNDENILRGEGAHAKNARKTHCLRGHELIGDNVRVRDSGSRVCKVCERERLSPRVGICRYCGAEAVRVINGGWCNPCWRVYQAEWARRKQAA